MPNFFFSSGASDFLTAERGDRRFWAIPAAPIACEVTYPTDRLGPTTVCAISDDTGFLDAAPLIELAANGQTLLLTHAQLQALMDAAETLQPPQMPAHREGLRSDTLMHLMPCAGPRRPAINPDTLWTGKAIAEGLRDEFWPEQTIDATEFVPSGGTEGYECIGTPMLFGEERREQRFVF